MVMSKKLLKNIALCVFSFFVWLLSFIFGWNVYKSTNSYVAYWDVLNTESLKDYNDLYKYIDEYEKKNK